MMQDKTPNPGHFKPGDPKPSNSGRRRGTPNRMPAALRHALTQTAIEVLPDVRSYMGRLSAAAMLSDHRAFHDMLTTLLDRTVGPAISDDESEDPENAAEDSAANP